MLEYFVCFSISCLIIFCIKNTKPKSPKFIMGSLIALSLPCLLAAFRAEWIGTDVRGYVIPLYDAALKSKSFGNFLNIELAGYRSVNEFEPGFILLVYISAKVFYSKAFLLGIIQLLIVLPIYMGLKRVEDKIPLWLGMMVYYLMYYNVTLNMMRQWIAMAFMFYAFKDLIEKRYFKYALFVFWGILFHKSALIGVVFIGIRIFFDKYLCQYNVKIVNGVKLSSDQLKEILLALVCCTIFFAPQLIVLILKEMGLADYAHYFYNSSTQFSIRQFIVRLPVLILFVVNGKNIQHRLEYKFLFGMAICDAIFCNYVTGAEYMYRVACWFAVYNIYSYPILIEALEKRYRRLAKILLVVCLTFYWWFYFCHKGSHETVPYVSIWGLK